MFIIGIIVLLVGFIVYFPIKAFLTEEEPDKKTPIPAIARAALMIIGAILIALSCVTFVQTGYTGIVTTFGKVENHTLDAGLSFKLPWQKVVKMDNRLQEQSLELPCFSSDIQEVNTSMTIGYRINQANAMQIYRGVGLKYVDIIITPRVQEVVKAVIAHYDANSLIEHRDEASQQIDHNLRETLAGYNIDLDYASITNIDFTDTFTDAVEAKVRAKEEKEKAETEAQQRLIEAEATAKAEVVAAEAEAEKSKLAADADLYVAQKQAEANRELNDSLNETLLDYYQITQVDALWDGVLPKYIGGQETVPMLNDVG